MGPAIWPTPSGAWGRDRDISAGQEGKYPKGFPVGFVAAARGCWGWEDDDRKGDIRNGGVTAEKVPVLKNAAFRGKGMVPSRQWDALCQHGGCLAPGRVGVPAGCLHPPRDPNGGCALLQSWDFGVLVQNRGLVPLFFGVLPQMTSWCWGSRKDTNSFPGTFPESTGTPSPQPGPFVGASSGSGLMQRTVTGGQQTPSGAGVPP